MSQARVTDFFSQRKKGVGGKSAKSHRTRSRPASDKDSVSCSSAVHEEFLRVIDEAVGVEDAGRKPAETLISSPRTPKRSSADAEFDLGAAVFSDSAKKKRPVGVSREADRTDKKTARKKLVLPEEKTQEKPQVLSEDISALKRRLQKIKKHAEEISAPASSSSSCPNDAAPAVRSPAAPAVDVAKLRSTVALAKDLAAKARRRKEEKAAEEIQQNQNQDGSESGTEQPAYLRYHTLAQAVPPGLTLPLHYKVLAEMFRSMDTVVAMLYNRSETATFSKIKQGVQDMMRRRFEESHVGQIGTVFPEAYTLRREKNVPTFSSSIARSSYQLTVEPVIHSDQRQSRPVLSASLLLERRRIFQQNLVSIVKRHHKVFLSSLVPVMDVPEDKLTRWHPRFNVDVLPGVEVGPLPRVPHMEKLVTAQEVLDKARSLITPKMEKALESLSRQTGDKDPESTSPRTSTVPETSTASAAQLPSSLKGVSQPLLDRIRAKEAQKLQASMTRNAGQEERLLMMSRLGELARILRNVFVAERKAALIMEVACSRMVASYRSALSTGEMEKHIRLLAEVAADWLTIHPIRKDLYLKLNKNVELSVVLEKLSVRLRAEEKI